MKKVGILLLCCVIGYVCIACVTENKTVKPFIYAEHESAYMSGDGWGYSEGFINTEPTEVKDRKQAIKLAKNEVKIIYNQIDVYYDSVSEMWLIVFSKKGVNDGYQNVYIDNNGITRLIGKL